MSFRPTTSQSKPLMPPSRRKKKKFHPPRHPQEGSWDSREFTTSATIPDYDDNYPLTGTRLLTLDFVVRSLRRRLWKALREDDVTTATRAYQATLPDFIHWLEEEHQEKKNRERKVAAKLVKRELTRQRSRSISPARSIEHPSSRYPRRQSFDQSSWMDQNKPLRRGRRPGRRMEDEENYHFENDNYELLKHQHQQRMETESVLGGPNISILQSRMNPSDPFIADDYLSPYDNSTYDHPARKTLPDPVKHAAEQRAIEEVKRRRRKSRSPRMAFRRMTMGHRSDRAGLATNSPGGSSDFDMVDSMRMASASNNVYNSPYYSYEFSADSQENNTEEEDPLITTPLHEAARMGAGDFVRYLLANGGDPNSKNGASQTAIHMCAGGYTAEEQKLVESAEAERDAEESEEFRTSSEEMVAPDKKKKKKHLRRSKKKPSSSSSAASSMPTTRLTSGIPPVVIPNESLELMRELLDSHETEATKDHKKSSKSKSKKRLFGKVLSFKNRKHRNDDKHEMEEDKEFEVSMYSKSQRNRRHKSKKANTERFNELANDRMEAMLALLAFVDRESGEGPSINAVDHNGRTSLHYAAELGRSGICTAMLSHFGIMLTIVDEMGTRTPCEIAADRRHTALAALLEARALLYIDPYGLDDEMMDMITAANEGSSSNASSNYKRKNPNGRLVPPFRWFITFSNEDVTNERANQLAEAREKLMQIVLESHSPGNAGEEKDRKQSAMREARDHNGLFGERNSNFQPYISAAVNDLLELKPPPPSDFETQETIECEDGDKKPPASNNGEISKSSDGAKKVPVLEDSPLEKYMTHHHWDLAAALDAFRQKRVQAFADAGIKNFFDDKKEEEKSTEDENACTCAICYDDEIEKEDWMTLGNCGHGFCKDCLTDYLKECAISRTPVHLVKCPDHNCNSGFSKPDIQSLLEKDHPDAMSCILEASKESFVTSHRNYRFCPHPGCSGIVHRFRQPKWASADYDESIINYTGAVCTAVTPSVKKIGNECTLTYEGVEDLDYTNCRSLQQPKKAHRFCFECGEAVHWPLTCETLAEWKRRVSDEIGKVDGKNGDSDFNELAQKIWLKNNTRPCPKCQVPIEKADGCNHMVCHSCHHEFCWICRQDWRLHSTDTGGFFRCNIWKEDDAERIMDKEDGDDDDEQDEYSNQNFFEGMMNEHGYGTSMHTARKAWKKKQDIKRFLHHYSRWEAHNESNTLEQKMADTVCIRLAPVVEAAIDFDGSPSFNFGGKGLSFIHNAFFELAECRSTLRHSYGFSFFRYPSKTITRSPPIKYLGNKRKEKFRFERLQSELETMTEQMSDIVARSHLRASQIQITYLTSGAAEKRLEFNNFMFQIHREEKREVVRQKQREEAAEDDNKKPSARYHIRDPEASSSQELFNRLMQMRDQRYEQTMTPYVTAADLPANGRELSMQLMAQDERLHAIGERLRGMEGLLRSHRNRGMNRDMYRDGDGRFSYLAHDEDESEFPGDALWACSLCTYMNTGGSFCAMCETPR